MAKNIKLKTNKNSVPVETYIKGLASDEDRMDAKSLLKIFSDVTKALPKMWGTSIIGFGEYTYYRKNGDKGQFMATGFSMRKSGPTLYIMPGYRFVEAQLAALGPHKLGKSCLYLKRLADVDEEVLKSIIRSGLTQLQKTHEVTLQN